MPDIVSKSFSTQPTALNVLFNLNLSRRPFLSQVIDFDLLRCTGFDSEHTSLFLCHIFTQRPMNDWKIEQSDGRCFVPQQLLAKCIRKSDSLQPKIYKALKPFWLLNSVSIARVVACVPQASLWQPAATAVDSETPCICARPSSARELPQENCRWFCPLNLWLPSGTAFGEIARWPAGAQTWTLTWTLPPDQRVVKVLSPSKPQHKLCGVWVLL